MKAFAKKVIRSVLPAAAVRAISKYNASRFESKVRRSPARVILKNSILPAVCERASVILWIGCRAYTREYPSVLETKGATCWTLEIDPMASCFGHSVRHVVGDLLRLEDYFSCNSFDWVLCNGIFGYGIESVEAQQESISQMARVLRPGGVLMLGWNTDKIADPMEMLALRFVPSDELGLGSRLAISGSSHVYDFCIVKN